MPKKICRFAFQAHDQKIVVNKLNNGSLSASDTATSCVYTVCVCVVGVASLFSIVSSSQHCDSRSAEKSPLFSSHNPCKNAHALQSACMRLCLRACQLQCVNTSSMLHTNPLTESAGPLGLPPSFPRLTHPSVLARTPQVDTVDILDPGVLWPLWSTHECRHGGGSSRPGKRDGGQGH